MPHRLPLVFTHGNGIPRPVYQKMLIGLSHRFVATGVDRFGHDPAYPVTDSWPRLIDQLRAHIAAVGAPVTLLGHGTGGWLNLLAAYRAPELVTAVLMLDAPLPTIAQARLLAALKRVGLGDLPGRVCGASADLPAFDAECQALYRRFGGRPADAFASGRSRDAEPRRFDGEVGRRIQQTFPTGLAALVEKGPPVDGSGRIVPCGMLIGRRSRAAHLCGLAATRHLVADKLVVIEGSHLFPLELPLVTAKEVVRLHDRMIGIDPASSFPGWRKAARTRASEQQQTIA
ncbi:MAG: alpha/beta hydrolase [Lautropia sp.]